MALRAQRSRIVEFKTRFYTVPKNFPLFVNRFKEPDDKLGSTQI